MEQLDIEQPPERLCWLEGDRREREALGGQPSQIGMVQLKGRVAGASLLEGHRRDQQSLTAEQGQLGVRTEVSGTGRGGGPELFATGSAEQHAADPLGERCLSGGRFSPRGHGEVSNHLTASARKTSGSRSDAFSGIAPSSGVSRDDR